MATVPVPGSDSSDGPGSPKAARVDRPKSRRAQEGQAVTLADIQKLLETQGENIRVSQAKEIRSAVSELKASTAAELKGIRDEVGRHADYISQLRDQGEKLEARLSALENARKDGSTAYPSSGGEAHQKNLVILGGWDAETHRDDLLPELREMLTKIGVAGEFQDVFTTGPRRGHAMGIVKWEAHLSEQELKKKLIRIVQEIRGASMSGPNMPAGQALWAAISKTKAERLRAGHAGKVKRLILEVNPAEKTNIDVEWGAGSLWLRSVMVASATRAAPSTNTKDGKGPGSWVDVAQIARSLGTSADHLAERWGVLMGE